MPAGISPESASIRFLAASIAIAARVFLVDDPIWGTVTTFSILRSGLSNFTGSVSKTSKPAPKICLFSSA